MQEQIKEFKKVLVANRGEIAIRVFRALNELGIQSVCVFSKEDKYSAFRTKADESYKLNPNKGPIDAYLDINEIIKIAKERNVDAIHPGYGLLSENPEFVEACEKNGVEFYYPSPIFCTDNAAMIGVAGYYEYMAGVRSGLDLNAVPNLKLGER